MGVWGYGSTGPTGYDYVQTGQPSNPEEGETWYDVDGDSAYVYDGASWVDMTVTGHGQLSNVSAGQHRTDSNIRTTVDGANINIAGDADTVDGQHASALGGGIADVYSIVYGGSSNATSGTITPASGNRLVCTYAKTTANGIGTAGTVTLYYENGNSDSYSNTTVHAPHRSGSLCDQIDHSSTDSGGLYLHVFEVTKA